MLKKIIVAGGVAAGTKAAAEQPADKIKTIKQQTDLPYRTAGLKALKNPLRAKKLRFFSQL